MAITTRAGKGAALSFAELDTNFSELDTRATNNANAASTNAGAITGNANAIGDLVSGTQPVGNADNLGGVTESVATANNTIVKRSGTGTVSGTPTAVLNIRNSSGTILKTINGISAT
jgi:membrane protein involved in colicin uptake